MNSTGWGITLGYFDGVHIGHRKLINRLREQSNELGLRTMILTFEQHPQRVIRPECSPVPLIYTPREKYEILCSLGVDRVEMIAFNQSLSRMTPEQFFENLLLKYDLKYGVVGFNYKFGLGGEGDAPLLKKYAANKGINVDVVKPVMLGNQLVSSSYIRRLLQEGNIKKANLCLGMNYRISGKIIEGKGRGVGLGAPTANINPPEGVLCPARGVYATNTDIRGEKYKSITNIGLNPTFSDETLSIETHICGLKGDLYDLYMTIEFIERIRDERKFCSREELKKQIQLDIKGLERPFK